MAKSPVEVWLWLLLVMQPFNKKTGYILSQCDYDATAASRDIRDGKFPFLNENEKKRTEQVRMGAIRQIQGICAENGVRIITFDDDEYPVLLKNIENPPIVLFAAGSLEGLERQLTISVVGARNVSDYGKRAAENICGPLARSGAAIISGLAVGADSAAHRACLNAGGRTVGVLGCGIFVNYPAENAQLKRDIVNKGGAVISELLPNSKSFGAYFPQRNRIISGLSMGTLVIEAGEKSGSLLTANHALEQGREVFCIPPHDIFSMRFSGVIPLLRDGAVPVFNYTDIINRFLIRYSGENYIKEMLADIESNPLVYHEPKPHVKNTKKSAGSSEPAGLENPVGKSAPALEPNEAAVLKMLAEQPADADALVEKSELDYGSLTEILTNLELLGYIGRRMDGSFEVKGE